MDIRFRHALLAMALCCPPAAASATDLNYDWLSAGALWIAPGDSILEHGWFVDGSYAVAPQFTLQGNFYHADVSQRTCSPSAGVCQSFGSNGEDLRLGLGWYMSLTDSADLLVDGYYARDDFHQTQLLEEFGSSLTCGTGGFTIPGGCAQTTSSDSSGSGYLLDAGLRWAATDALQFRGFLGHLHVSNDGTFNFLRGEASYAFTPHWALLLDAVHYSTPQNQYRLGLRWSF